MIEGLGPYPAYRDSAVEWLGRVPEGWELRRLRHSIESAVTGVWGEEPDGENDVVPCIRVADFDRVRYRVRMSSPTLRSITTAERAGRMLRSGDLLLEKSGGGDQQPVGFVALYDHERPAVCSNFVARMRPAPDHDAGYLTYLHATMYAAGANIAAIKQTTGIQNLDIRAYLGQRVALPPLRDQRAIVRFLDHADRLIQRYIRAKERLIELLEEEKQAIIHRAVTRGLDPNVKLKPSGVELLGDVPEHWQSTTLHRITDRARPIMYGIVLPGPSVDDGVFIVKGGNCEPGRLRPELLSRTSYEIEEKHVRSRLRKDDIVYAIRGSIGSAEMVPAELEGANLTQDAARIAPGRNVEPRWLLHVVRSSAFFRKLDAGAVGAAVRGINIRDLKRADLAIPPIDEQQAIAEHLDLSLNKLSTASDRAAAEIQLLGEYRTRLISDVVTGKLDVRDAATKLPHDSAADPSEVDEVLEEAVA